MKYRIKEESSCSQVLSFMLFWWLMCLFGGPDPYYIQYKKYWWWPFWSDYKNSAGIVPHFKTMADAGRYIDNLNKN